MSMDDQRDGPSRGGFSRRDFLRGGAIAGALGTGLLSGELAEGAKGEARTEAGVEVWGPGPVPVRLRINGKSYDLKLEPRTTLLDALREELELTGAKRVCDRGTCGACTVLVDGKAVYACSQLAIDVQRQPIQTIEGLGRPERLHPLQAAFVEHDAQQCGFCTPGFVMAAKALLDRTPNPNLADVHQGLSGNFCRCGTYAGLRQAVLAAAPLVAGMDGETEEPETERIARPDESVRDIETVDKARAEGKKHGKEHRKKGKKKGKGRHG
jgi:xanthine dehydrogenase YagT iron-sulfur-binding subunit